MDIAFPGFSALRWAFGFRPWMVSIVLALTLAASLTAQQSGGLTEVLLTTSHFGTGTVVINGTSYTVTGTGMASPTKTSVMLDLSKPLVVAVGPTAIPKPGVEYRAETLTLYFIGVDRSNESYSPPRQVTIQDPCGLENIFVDRTRYIEVKAVAQGPGQVRQQSPALSDGYFYRSPAPIYFDAIPDPGMIFKGWKRYGLFHLPHVFSEPETLVALFAAPLTPPPPLVIEGNIPTFRYRSTPQVLQSTFRVTASTAVTSWGLEAHCNYNSFGLRVFQTSDITPFDVTLTLDPDTADGNHIPDNEYSCLFQVHRRDGGEELAIPFKVILGASAPEPELTDAVVEAVVDAASYRPQSLAAGSIFSVFGKRLATGEAQAQTLPLPTKLATTQVRLNIGGQSWMVPLFYVSPSQVNILVPPEVPSGGGFLEVVRDDIASPARAVTIESAAPALFTANADGKGAPAGYVIRARGERQDRSEVAHCPEGAPCIPLQVISTDPDEEIFLILFGTGFRNDRRAIPEAQIGALMAEVVFFGPHPDFAGLDQINIRVPRALLGTGPQTVVLRHSGKQTNEVTVQF